MVLRSSMETWAIEMDRCNVDVFVQVGGTLVNNRYIGSYRLFQTAMAKYNEIKSFIDKHNIKTLVYSQKEFQRRESQLQKHLLRCRQNEEENKETHREEVKAVGENFLAQHKLQDCENAKLRDEMTILQEKLEKSIDEKFDLVQQHQQLQKQYQIHQQLQQQQQQQLQQQSHPMDTTPPPPARQHDCYTVYDLGKNMYITTEARYDVPSTPAAGEYSCCQLPILDDSLERDLLDKFLLNTSEGEVAPVQRTQMKTPDTKTLDKALAQRMSVERRRVATTTRTTTATTTTTTIATSKVIKQKEPDVLKVACKNLNWPRQVVNGTTDRNHRYLLRQRSRVVDC